ncbi:MAG: hypothetical protein BAJATHORv1_40112 [Candidatus Thorarchaeota archaeon]|nr:MAG: hypothetical protein BAJATHORv1_40112 [Candidatus Thorarchaeota archaeon]
MCAKEIIDSAFLSERLKRMKRTGWIMTGVPDSFQESIADHIIGTACITILLCNALINEKVEIDLEKAVTIAIVHDISEAIITDIPKSMRNLDDSLRESKKTIEMKAIPHLIKNDQDRISNLLKDYHEQDSAESIIVAAADKLDMYIHAITMERAGVPAEQFVSFFEDIDDFIVQFEYIEIIAEIAKNLKTMHEDFLKRDSKKVSLDSTGN